MVWPFTRKNVDNLEKKEVAIANSIYMSSYDGTLTNSKQFQEYQAEGYATNPIIYRCVQEISTNAARVGLCMVDKEGEVIYEHPVLDLLNRPSPVASREKFFKQLFVDKLTVGNAYTLGTGPESGPPKMLFRLDPKDISVRKPKLGNVPTAYVFKPHTKDEKVFEVDELTGASQVMHDFTVNPLDQFIGLPPLAIGAISGDIVNYGLEWNKSLLRNSGTPSGYLKTKSKLDDNQYNRLKEFASRVFAGRNNAGRVQVLSGDLEWQETSKTPRDMDFKESLSKADMYIAMTYGVPLPLISNDAATFNNVELAQEKLYEDTIIPFLDEFLNTLNNYLLPKFDETKYKIAYKLDDVPALEAKRARKFERITKAVDSGIISRDEAREAMDYEPMGGHAEELLVPSGLIPINFGFEDESTADDPNLDADDEEAKLYNYYLEQGLGHDAILRELFYSFGIKKVTSVPPRAAQDNARKALRWRDEHPDETRRGLTSVGWRIASQIASGKALSNRTVKRIAALNKRRQNATVTPNLKDEPWRDRGHVAWLGWGGTPGVEWAMHKSKEIDLDSTKDDEAEYEKKASEILSRLDDE